MQSRRFNVGWIVHQTLPVLLRHALRADESAYVDGQRCACRQALLLSLYALIDVLPCKFCRESFERFVQQTDVDRRLLDAPSDWRDFVSVWFDLHNCVNRKLDKDVATDIAQHYAVAPSPRCFIDALFDWLALVAINYAKFDDVEKPVLESQLIAVEKCNVLRTARLIKKATLNDDRPAFVRAMHRVLFPRWRDQSRVIAMHVLYVHSLAQSLVCTQSAEIRQCGEALRFAFFGNDIDSFHSSTSFFDALCRARTACTDEQVDCERWRARVESFRAQSCNGVACK